MIALAIVLGALLLLMLMPVGVRAVFEADLTVWLTLFGIRLQLFPGKEKPKKKKKSKKSSTEKQPKKVVPRGDLREYLKLLAKLLGKLHRKLLIRELTLHAVFGGSEPELNYGRAWAVIGGIMPIIEETFRIRKRDVGAYLCAEQSEIRIIARAHAVVSFFTILRISLHALRGYLNIQKNDTKKAV